MQRIQFYPSTTLWAILKTEASKNGVSVSQLVIDLLEDHYSLNKNSANVTNLTATALDEIAIFIQISPPNTKFDLNTASATYCGIDMVAGKKPATTKATIGRSFAAQLRKGKFPNVQLLVKDGKKVMSFANNANMYEII